MENSKINRYTTAYSPLFKSYVKILKVRNNKDTRIYDCIVYDAELNETFPCMFTDMELEDFK